MAYSDYDTPAEFFGNGYSLTSNEVRLTTSTDSGVTIGTVTADDSTDVLTCSGHALLVGDIVQFTTTGTLPAGLSTSTDYYVITVPTSDTFTISATAGGTVLDITDTGTGTHSVKAMGLLPELTDTEANATTGDARKVCWSIIDMIYKRLEAIPSADRPGKLTVVSSTRFDSLNNELVKTYNFTVRSESQPFEVAPE
jgi:hypothetical protein